MEIHSTFESFIKSKLNSITESAKDNKEYVTKLNGQSIYYSNKYAKKDKDRFVIIKDGKQIYDTEFLSDALKHVQGDEKPNPSTIKKFKELCDRFCPTSKKEIDELWK